MSDEKLFSMMRESLMDYQPQVPQAVYAGMRRKLLWSSFMRFNATSLNAWYVGAVIIGAALACQMWCSNASGAQKAQAGAWHEGVILTAAAANVQVAPSCSASQPSVSADKFSREGKTAPAKGPSSANSEKANLVADCSETPQAVSETSASAMPNEATGADATPVVHGLNKSEEDNIPAKGKRTLRVKQYTAPDEK
jgi:hypothetical protein